MLRPITLLFLHYKSWGLALGLVGTVFALSTAILPPADWDAHVLMHSLKLGELLAKGNLTPEQVAAAEELLLAIIRYTNEYADFNKRLDDISTVFFQTQTASATLDIHYPPTIFPFLPYAKLLFSYWVKVLLVTYLSDADILYLNISTPVTFPDVIFPNFITDPPPSYFIYMDAVVRFNTAFNIRDYGPQIIDGGRESLVFLLGGLFATVAVPVMIIAWYFYSSFITFPDGWTVGIEQLPELLLDTALCSWYGLLTLRQAQATGAVKLSAEEIAAIPAKTVESLEAFLAKHDTISVVLPPSPERGSLTCSISVEDCLPISSAEQANALHNAIIQGTHFSLSLPVPAPTFKMADWSDNLDVVMQQTLELQASSNYFEMVYTLQMVEGACELFLRLIIFLFTGSFS